MNCWICGSIADSEEHKFKSSLIKDLYGKKFNDALIFKICSHDIEESTDKILQGPNSKLLKYQKSICKECNNSKTQKHDIEFDVFIKYCIKEYDKDLILKIIDLKKIYPLETDNHLNDLYKYFAKIIGCRLFECGHSKKLNLLTQFINVQIENNFLVLKFETKEDTKIIHV
jgi:hypothetical protein